MRTGWRSGNTFRESIAFVLLVLGLVISGAAVFAQNSKPLKGLALVVGQSKYEHLPQLANPIRDADAIKSLLDRLGFEVTLATDLDARKLRRELRDFAADAAEEKADVAVVYYSGHGIEAGGENFLLPIDAIALGNEADRSKLVPLSPVLDELKAAVAVSILFLDACRSNPFPPETFVQNESQAQVIGAGGLSAVKGFAQAEAEDESNIGMLIGFAAEPGKAALDGEPGSNSPYAAAILRLLPAMQGEEFGTVMRMVTEEVYLKTARKQRPWMNESLTKLLYFGAPLVEVEGEDADIEKERRPLLLMISNLPEDQRKLVENTAGNGGVALDTIYGMLRALGTDTSRDAEDLDRILRAQIERVKKDMAERAAIRSPDAEIRRLADLAARALAEGALDANLKYWEAAKARLAEIGKTLDATEADLQARRLEAGEVLARTAEAYRLKFDYLAAAENFSAAFAQVERWDSRRAWYYRISQADALQEHGQEKGDRIVLQQAIDLYETGLERISRETDPDLWTSAQINFGNALAIRGDREPGTETLLKALRAYDAALGELTPAKPSLLRAMAQINRANVLGILGERDGGTASLNKAIQSYETALGVLTREQSPLEWATVQNNLGNVLRLQGTWERSKESLLKAVNSYEAALTERTRDRTPVTWAMTMNGLGTALESLGEQEDGTENIVKAIGVYEAALTGISRERTPLLWAMTQVNLGTAFQIMGERDGDSTQLVKAAHTYEAALFEFTRERTAQQWAATQHNLGNTLSILGERENAMTTLVRAVEAFEAALTVRTQAGTPLPWAATQESMGWTLGQLGQLTKSRETVSRGKEAMRQAWATYKAAGYDDDLYFGRRIRKLDEILAKLK